jgi:hypothetical protein
MESMNAAPATNPNLPLVSDSIDDVGKSTWSYLNRHAAAFIGVCVGTVLLEILLIYWKVEDLRVYILPLAIPFGWYSSVRSRIQHEFMQQFAEANGFTYSINRGPSGLDGSLFRIGDNRSFFDVVTGQYASHPVALFTYSYTTGSGKSRQVHQYTVFDVQFDTAMVDILLESGGHSFVEFGGSMFSSLTGHELVKLEGDFNKYFSLSVPKGYEIEALEIFTPDVMAELIDRCKGLSLEIVNDHLYIYDHKIVCTKVDLYELYGVAQYFDEKLGPVLGRMKTSVEAMQQVQASQ